ncbi:MAG: MFS transporter [Bradymonadales bacterium]|nr:MAG: MFS transporter [Bradymonadales bacterium]
MLKTLDPQVARKRQVRAWAFYDFSTQGYQVTTASALFPAYFARGIAPDGLSLLGIHFPPEALWGFGVGLAAAIVFILAPILGAIADHGGYKKRFLMFFAYGGCLFASLLFFAIPGWVWFSLVFFVLAQVFYTSGNVFYDAFLPEVADTDEEMDRASGVGFAYGYLGGFLQFAGALVLVSAHDWFGLTETMAIRICLLSAGLWWLGFSVYSFRVLKETKKELPPRVVPEIIGDGVNRTWQSIKLLPRFPSLLLFLVAYFFYNDGIQTVISISGVYGSGTLGLSTQVIMLTFLIVQLIAIGGAMAFSSLAVRWGTKNTLIVGLFAWSAIVVGAFFLRTGDALGFIFLGAMIGLVLGGTQSLSRSLFASMIPRTSSAGFFGFYSIFNKLSAILGPILFGVMTTAFSSARPAVLMILIFFVVGTFLLWFLDLDKARRSKQQLEEALREEVF